MANPDFENLKHLQNPGHLPLTSLREGYLKEIFCIFSFLKGNQNSLIVFDLTKPDIDLSKFPREGWSETAYGECKEELPPNAPQERGISVTMRAFFYSYHAGDTMNRC